MIYHPSHLIDKKTKTQRSLSGRRSFPTQGACSLQGQENHCLLRLPTPFLLMPVSQGKFRVKSYLLGEAFGDGERLRPIALSAPL